LELKILRYAADGIWLTAFTEVENLSETMQLKQIDSTKLSALIFQVSNI
jgi:hypothetical protein